MDSFTNFIRPELLILVPVLYAIGIAAKKSKHFSDRYIPLILGGAGVLLAVIWVLATTDIIDAKGALMAIFVALTQGVLCAAASVYVNQAAVVQPKKDGE